MKTYTLRAKVVERPQNECTIATNNSQHKSCNAKKKIIEWILFVKQRKGEMKAILPITSSMARASLFLF